MVYRGGDALSGAVFNGLTKAMGLPLAAVALASIPVAGLWLFMSSRFDAALKARLAAARETLLARTTAEAIQRAKDYRLI